MNMSLPSNSTGLELKKDLEFEKKLKSKLKTASKVSEVVTQFTFAARYIKDEANPFSLKGKSLISTPLLPSAVAMLPAIIEVVTLGLKAKDIYEAHNNVKSLDTAIRNIEEENVDKKSFEEKEYNEKELRVAKFSYDTNSFREKQFRFYFFTGSIRVIGKVVSCIPIPEAWGLRMVFWCLAWSLEVVVYKIPRWCLNKLRDKAFEEYKNKKRSIILKLFDIEKSSTRQLEKLEENAEFILRLMELIPVLERKGIDIKEKEKRIYLYIQPYIRKNKILEEFLNFKKMVCQTNSNNEFKSTRVFLKNVLSKDITT